MKPITLVRIRIAIYTLVSLGVAWQTSMKDVKWSDLDLVQVTCLFAGILVLWGNTMTAFFDKSVWKWDQAQQSTNGNAAKP